MILSAGLACDIAASFLRVPRMILLVGAGALLGPSVAGAIDVPLDSMVALHVPDADVAVTVVALAILVTLAVQTTTKRWLAQRLGLLEPAD